MLTRSPAEILSSVGSRVFGPVLAIFLAFFVSSFLLLAVGANPLTAFWAMIQGSLVGASSLAVTGVRMTPLLFAGLAVAVAFRARLLNIGAEGQLYLGAIGATLVALLPFSMPMIVHLPFAILAGFVGGAIWAFIPGYFRAYHGVSEIVVTLMLNFVGIHLASYMVNTRYGPIGERGASYAQSPLIDESVRLPRLMAGTSLHAGLILGIILAIGLYFLIGHTTWGFRLRMIGSNPFAGNYAGVNTPFEILRVMLVSGGLAGLAGASEVLGLRYRLFDGFSPGYGFDAIAVALLANSNPLGVIFTAGFFGALRAGSNRMQQATGVDVSVVFMIQALVILFIIAGVLLQWIAQRRLATHHRIETQGSGNGD